MPKLIGKVRARTLACMACWPCARQRGGASPPLAPTRLCMSPLALQIEGRGNGIKTNVVNNVDIAKALARPPECACRSSVPCVLAQPWHPHGSADHLCPCLNIVLALVRAISAGNLPVLVRCSAGLHIHAQLLLHCPALRRAQTSSSFTAASWVPRPTLTRQQARPSSTAHTTPRNCPSCWSRSSKSTSSATRAAIQRLWSRSRRSSSTSSARPVATSLMWICVTRHGNVPAPRTGPPTLPGASQRICFCARPASPLTHASVLRCRLIAGQHIHSQEPA